MGKLVVRGWVGGVKRALLSTKASSQNKELLVLYGSQTGTGESLARMLVPHALNHKFEARLEPMNSAVERLQKKPAPAAIACVCSTFGTGEFPSNAGKFFRALEQHELDGTLKGVPYSILGLGDSTHEEHFNAAAKKLDVAFKQAGAVSAQKLALSDDSSAGGHDAAYREWKRGLWKALGQDAGEATVLYVLKPAQTNRADVLGHAPGYLEAAVAASERLSAPGYEPVFQKVSLELATKPKMDEHVMVQPQNSDDLVARMARRLKVDPEWIVRIAPILAEDPSLFCGKHLAVGTLLREVVDLNGAPPRSFLEGLAELATSESDKVALDALANDLSSASEYEALTRHSAFTLVDALERFPEVPVTLEYLLSYAPRITARAYSVAGRVTSTPQGRFLVDLVFKEPVVRIGDFEHRGLASGMLRRLRVGDPVSVAVTPRAVGRIPRVDKPLLIVALGTGVSSARALIHQRHDAFDAGGREQRPPKTVLLYGFRDAGKDELFVDEFATYQQQGWLEVHSTSSADGRTPLDAIDASIVDFLKSPRGGDKEKDGGGGGGVAYFGLGGDVPFMVSSKLAQVGLDVPLLKATGRYLEEAFSREPDLEQLWHESHSLATRHRGATTLADRIGGADKADMMCFQCGQTLKGVGCTKVGVCGKTPRVAALQDLVVHRAKVLGLYAHELASRRRSREAESVDSLLLHSLFATLTNVNFDEARFVELAVKLAQETQRLKALLCDAYPPRGGGETVETKREPLFADDADARTPDALIELGKSVGLLQRFADPATQSAQGVREMLLYGIKGIAAYAEHALVNRRSDAEINAFLRKALAFLATKPGDGETDLGAGLALCLEAGSINVSTMALLYDSHSSTLGAPSPHAAPIKPKPGKAILVSGHDLILLEALLKKTQPLNINVYTHGEMLPAHGYPKLRQYPNLVGHFGQAWQRQHVEFPHFKGAILVTTNCLTEPQDAYKDRLFTAGAVGFPGSTHIGDDVETVDFEPLIRAAREAPGFEPGDVDFDYPDPVGIKKRPESLTVGFGHEAVLGAAATILDEVKKGTITRFYLVGGCDGYEGGRSYFTDLVANLPDTSVVLTLGCGKYRVNHLDLGTVGDTGIPRVLDMGQCNDSFSAVQVALALAKALDCQVSDLPLSIVLSWFEQKSVAVLLSCLSLGLKPIHIGPTLPAFVTPQVLDKLVSDFGILPIGDPINDGKIMAAAKGAS